MIKNNLDFYLHFLYDQIKLNNLEEQITIVKKFGDFVIEDKNTYKKKIKVKSCISKIKLANNKFLLVEDLPLNFLISQTIFLGDKVKLKSFKFKKKKEEYIIDEKLLKVLNKNLIDEKSINDLEVKELFNLKYSFTFQQPKIISEFKTYILKKTKIDLNRLHIIDSDKIELFLPNIKKSHLIIAQYLKLPIISFIKNGFIRDTTINVLDYNSQIELIKPILKFEKEILWDFQKETENKLYKDISNLIVLKYDLNYVIKRIKECPKVNFNKEKYIELIKKIKEIKISTPNKINYDKSENLLLPLFRSIKSEKFVKIKDTTDFLEITGLKFNLDFNKLKNIHIQTINGEKARFVELYLNKRAEKTLDFILTNKTKNNMILFSDINELILKVLKSNEILTGIVKIEKIHEKNILQHKNLLEKIFKILLIKTIKFNKLPVQKRPKKMTEFYFLSVFNRIYLHYEDYKKFPLKRDFLKFLIKKLEEVLLVLKNIEINFEDLYYLTQIILLNSHLLKEFNEEFSEEFKKTFDEYFKGLNLHLFLKTKISDNIERFILDSAMANKLAKKEEITILLKKEIPKNLLSPRIKVLDGEMPHKTLIKPIYKKLISVFPYSYKEVGEIIKRSDLNPTFAENFIIFKNKKIKIDKTYFTTFSIYQRHKLFSENVYFKLLIKKKLKI